MSDRNEFDPYDALYRCPVCERNTTVNVTATCMRVLRLNDDGRVMDGSTYWESFDLDSMAECNESKCGHKAPLREFVRGYSFPEDTPERIKTCPGCSYPMMLGPDKTTVSCSNVHDECYVDIPLWVWKLKPGDLVDWVDPDEGECSKRIAIVTIEVSPGGPRDGMVRIWGSDEEDLECLVCELSPVNLDNGPLAHADLSHNAVCPKCSKGVDHNEAIERDEATLDPFTCEQCGTRFTVYCHQMFESVECRE